MTKDKLEGTGYLHAKKLSLKDELQSLIDLNSIAGSSKRTKRILELKKLLES